LKDKGRRDHTLNSTPRGPTNGVQFTFTGGAHREFAIASGEMTDAEFLAFNEARMAAGYNGFQ
jgi:hypothetical protein